MAPLGLVGLFAHAESDPVSRNIDLHHAHLDDIPGLHHLVRILDEPVRQLADVNEAVLVDPDIHECTEGGDVGDGAFQPHAGLKVSDLVYIFRERRCLEGGSRISSGLFQLAKDVANSGQAETVIDEPLGLNAQVGFRVGLNGAEVAPAGNVDLSSKVIGLRVN